MALLFTQFAKIHSEMANRADPYQTASSEAAWSWPPLFEYVILSETLLYKILGHYHKHIWQSEIITTNYLE